MAQVKDPVCGMVIDSKTAKYKSEFEGQTYYFCAPGCKTAFDKEPRRYAHPQQDQHRHHGHS
ncbi:MAG: YHS domain-containing protein [Caldilinea sp.]|nr:YHS domain-containing protein [Caldilinea sp.]